MPHHRAAGQLSPSYDTGGIMQRFFIILGTGFFLITLASQAEDWRLDREGVDLSATHAQASTTTKYP